MYYFYDSYGNLAKIYRHTSSTTKKIYNVVTNSQGDVIAIYDFYGVLVCTYEYDAWGNLTFARDSAGNIITSQNHIAFLNPIRYRGYYYDSEIGMYYLQSRYYDPNTGRFINADGYITTGQGVLSYNMYAYCMNNPVMYSDPSGEWPDIECPQWLKDIKDDLESIGKGIKKVWRETKPFREALSKFFDVYDQVEKIKKANDAVKEKQEFINRMTEDIYNLAVNDRYMIPTIKFSVYDQDEYDEICWDGIDRMKQEIEICSYIPEYSDIGEVFFDQLSKESQNYLIRRFPDLYPKVYSKCARHYAAKGAILP